jgi:hypothetical protein
MDAFMALAEKIELDSGRENVTMTKLYGFRLSGLKTKPSLYQYVRYGLARKILSVTTLHDRRCFGDIKCYYVTTTGRQLLQVWKQCRKEEKGKNGN